MTSGKALSNLGRNFTFPQPSKTALGWLYASSFLIRIEGDLPASASYPQCYGFVWTAGILPKNRALFSHKFDRGPNSVLVSAITIRNMPPEGIVLEGSNNSWQPRERWPGKKAAASALENSL